LVLELLSRRDEESVLEEENDEVFSTKVETALPLSTQPVDQQNTTDEVIQMEQAWQTQCKNFSLSLYKKCWKSQRRNLLAF